MGYAPPTPPPAVLLPRRAGPDAASAAVADGPDQSWRHLR